MDPFIIERGNGLSEHRFFINWWKS